jgi:uncharacterized protein YjbJ (UPF0337 family)
MNRDEVKGQAQAVKGKMKQAVGDLTDDKRLHDEGRADEATGEARATVGKARRKVGEAVERLGESIKK